MKIRTTGRTNSYAKARVIDRKWSKKSLALSRQLDNKELSEAEYENRRALLREKYGTTDLKLKDEYLNEKVKLTKAPLWIYGSEAEINISPRTGEPDGKIYWMMPDDYLRLAGLDKRRVRVDSVEYQVKQFKAGKGVYVGHLKVEDGQVINQEGRHRALAAKKCGIEKIPVLVYGKGFENFSPANTKPQF
jgi:hypothetical protein